MTYGTLNFMFGNPTGFQSPASADWGEQMLNGVATQTLRHMFTQSDSVQVTVRCNPASKLLQGSIDSFKMHGRGLVIRKDFRTEEMSFETDAVAIDFASILKGKLSLKQPTQAIAQVVLTEEDINKAFQAQLVRQHLENVKAEALLALSGGEPVSFRDVAVELLPDNRVALRARTDLPNRKDVPIAMTAVLTTIRRRRVAFEDATFDGEGVPEDLQGLSKLLTEALGNILNEMVDLDRFDLDGVTMRLNRLETRGKTLVFSGYAQIERLPRNAKG